MSQLANRLIPLKKGLGEFHQGFDVLPTRVWTLAFKQENYERITINHNL